MPCPTSSSSVDRETIPGYCLQNEGQNRYGSTIHTFSFSLTHIDELSFVARVAPQANSLLYQRRWYAHVCALSNILGVETWGRGPPPTTSAEDDDDPVLLATLCKLRSLFSLRVPCMHIYIYRCEGQPFASIHTYIDSFVFIPIVLLIQTFTGLYLFTCVQCEPVNFRRVLFLKCFFLLFLEHLRVLIE